MGIFLSGREVKESLHRIKDGHLLPHLNIRLIKRRTMLNDNKETKICKKCGRELPLDRYQFYKMSNILKRPIQCEGYYLYDTDDKVGRKQVRKHYSQDVRKMLYRLAEGKCALCGKKLAFSEMTLDHIIPLTQNGNDEVENLQVCCYQCNQLKGSILPADLMQKVTEIFLYQMEKKYSKRIWWKSAQYLLRSCIK